MIDVIIPISIYQNLTDFLNYFEESKYMETTNDIRMIGKGTCVNNIMNSRVF